METVCIKMVNCFVFRLCEKSKHHLFFIIIIIISSSSAEIFTLGLLNLNALRALGDKIEWGMDPLKLIKIVVLFSLAPTGNDVELQSNQ